MEAIHWILAAIFGAVVGWSLRGRIAKAAGQTVGADQVALRRNVNEAEDRYLEVLRREIGNILLEIDPDLMIRTYEKGWRYQDELKAAGTERIAADLKSITLKYKFFSEFDVLGTRHFIPYGDARWSLSDDELVDIYLDISKMIMLPRLSDTTRSSFELFADEEFKVLLKTVRRCKDRAFKKRIQGAVDRYYALRRVIDRHGSREARDQICSLEEADLEVFRLPNTSPENELGIVFKKTNECGIYGTFHHDDGKLSESFYRSDSAFQNRDYIDAP
jgi:hypothetical protein